MKKKTTIIMILLVTIFLILITIYFVDIYMMRNNKPVVFSTWGYDYAPPEVLGEVVNIVDKTKENNNFACGMALEQIFEDGKNKYYLNCIKSDNIIVKYEKGYEENLKNALINGTVRISDLDKFNIDYIVQEKEFQKENSFIATVIGKTATYIIVKPNKNESESGSADKIVVEHGKDHMYEIGSKVVICYTGDIMETYPARINTSDIFILE